jgi:hypothetical protein
MRMLGTISDWSEAVLTSLAGAMALFFAAIPKVIAFAIILVLGWVLAGLIARGAGALLRGVRFDELSERSGFAAFVANAGVRAGPTDFLAALVKWFVRLIVLVVAFDALGLPAVSDVLRQLLLWLPNLAVAIVVLIIGGLLANAAAGMLRGATASAGLRHPELIANVGRVAVWIFAIIVAVNQLGIAQTLVNTLFMGAVALVVLALGLSFGLGGRDVAGRLLEQWVEEARRAAPRMAQAAEDERAEERAVKGGGAPARGYSGEERG